MATFHELPEWATKEQGVAILAKLEELKGVPITVEARTKDGVTVTGQEVYLYEGSDDKGYFIQAAPYNGQPVTFMVRKGMQYFIKISSKLAEHYSPSTATGFAENATTVILTYEDISSVNTFAAVQAVIANIVEMYPTNEERVAAGRTALIGREIPDTWVSDDGVSALDDPMIVVDVDAYETIDGEIKIGAKLQRKYATVASIQFDAPEQEEAHEETEPTAQDGIYYIGKNAAGSLSKLNLKTGDAIPYASYAAIYRNKYNDTAIVSNGSGRYEYSAWRQYLNSFAPRGEWWHRMHAGQMPPAGSDSRGYLAGCSEALMAAIKRVKVTTYAASADGGDIYGVFDYFFLPSGTEMNGSVNSNEGIPSKYWVDAMGTTVQDNGSNNGRKIYKVNAHSSSVNCWLRSASRGTSYYVWIVTTGGQLNGNLYSYSGTASYQYAGCPACVIY